MTTALGDLAISMELIAIGIGAMLLVWGKRNDGPGVVLARCAGYMVGILATALLITSAYMSYRVFSVHHHMKSKPPVVRGMH